MPSDEEAYQHCMQQGLAAFNELRATDFEDKFRKEFLEFVTKKLVNIHSGREAINIHNFNTNDFYVRFLKAHEGEFDYSMITELVDLRAGLIVPHPVPLAKEMFKFTMTFGLIRRDRTPNERLEYAHAVLELSNLSSWLNTLKEHFHDLFITRNAVEGASTAAIQVNQEYTKELNALQSTVQKLTAEMKELKERNKELESQIFVRNSKKPKLTKDQEEAGLTTEDIQISCKSKSKDPLDILRHLLDSIQYDQSKPLDEKSFPKITNQMDATILVKQMKVSKIEAHTHIPFLIIIMMSCIATVRKCGEAYSLRATQLA
eukprot:Colp12_sorted_trinity150504_noHs@9047